LGWMCVPRNSNAFKSDVVLPKMSELLYGLVSKQTEAEKKEMKKLCGGQCFCLDGDAWTSGRVDDKWFEPKKDNLGDKGALKVEHGMFWEEQKERMSDLI
jgi:hypothetical protein